MTDAQTITRALGGKWYRHYGRACCPACNGSNKHNPSLSVKQGAGGNLLLWCFKGCDFSDILDALKFRGVVEGRCDYRPPVAEDISRHRTEVEAEAAKRAVQAERCWQEAQLIAGTLAETYLRNRSITCELHDTLRFHPACWHASAKRFPALVAIIGGTERFAVHRTYLDGPAKADVHPNKAMLGSVRGGAVRLSEGPGPLVVAEGIETALSLRCGLLRDCGPVWAALSTSGMTGLNLPPEPGELIVASDGDAPGREAACDLAQRASSLGWQVSTTDPGNGLDFNDLLQSGVAA